MKLSIVSSLYWSAAYLEEFHSRCTRAAEEFAGADYELILVNDGSPDDSLKKALALRSADPHVTVIDLSRNFGHHKAMMAGLAHATGEYVFLVDADLEEDPAWLLEFSERMARENCDVVFGVQASRKGGWFERLSGWVFYRLFSLLTGFDFPANVVTARLMTKRYVDALLLHQEREVSIGGLFYLTGFSQVSQTVVKKHLSKSTYTLGKKVSTFVNSVTAFSNKPLIWIFFLGISVFVLALFISVYFVIAALFLGDPPSGWTSLIISVWALGGLVISSVGVVGIYIAKIFSEVKQRPNTIVRHVYTGKSRVDDGLTSNDQPWMEETADNS